MECISSRFLWINACSRRVHKRKRGTRCGPHAICIQRFYWRTLHFGRLNIPILQSIPRFHSCPYCRCHIISANEVRCIHQRHKYRGTRADARQELNIHNHNVHGKSGNTLWNLTFELNVLQISHCVATVCNLGFESTNLQLSSNYRIFIDTLRFSTS